MPSIIYVRLMDMNYEYKAPFKHSQLLPNSPLEAVKSLCHVGRGKDKQAGDGCPKPKGNILATEGNRKKAQLTCQGDCHLLINLPSWERMN